MEPLKTFFEPAFEGKRIAIDTLKKFSEDNLARLTTNPGAPGGPIAGLITATGAAHIAYFGEISDVDVAKAVQEGFTVAVDQKFEEFQARVQKEHGLIKYTFNNMPAYQEFFPHGLTEYTNATKASVETLMLRMVEALTNNPNPGIPTTLKDEFQAYHDDYQELRAAQLGKKGNADTQRTERDAARAALELQLWKNVLTISLAHIGNVEACMAYFDESILKGSPEEDEEEGGDTPPTP